jgi:hypothetical protein
MGENDYQSGYRGEQFHHGMDRTAYESGKAQKDLEGALGGGGGVVASSGGGSPLGLVFLAPLMLPSYPAGSILTLTILGVVAKLLEAVHVPVPAMIFICLAVAFPAIFAGLWVERKVSMNGVYRVFRLIWRTVVFGMAIFAGSLISSLGLAKQRINLDMIMNNLDQSAGALLWTAILMTGVFWLLRRADRIYFPVSGVLEEGPVADVQVKTVLKPKSANQRILMSVIWFVPAALVAHLIIRLAIEAYFGSTQSAPDMESLRRAFYQKNMIYLYVADVAVWLILSIKGLLPGTGRNK